MAWEQPGFKVTMIAHADLSAAQYHFVQLVADNEVDLCVNLTDKVFGILQNAPTALGQPAEVMLMGVSKLRVGAGGAIGVGDSVGTDAASEGVTKADGVNVTHYVPAICLEGAAAGAIASVFINSVPNRAA